MPRQPIEIPHRVENLTILSPEGELDSALEPRVDPKDLRRLFQAMLTSRRFDERCFKMQRQGRMGTYAPTRGQEAGSLGFAYALEKRDWMIPAFRETCGMHWRGWPLVKFMLFWAGHEEGAVPPPGVNDTPICVPVATQCQLGAGIAWGLRLRQEGGVCLTFIGDGGTSEGDFHEAMNFAGVYQLPLVMVVQNNGWAISLPRDRQTASPTIAQKAIAYGFDAIQVDGNDLLATVAAGREAVDRARNGGGPTLVEAVTYRLGVHTTADDPKKYRTEEEVAEWERRDPIPRFRNYLKGKGLLDEKVEQVIDEEITRTLDEAVKAYDAYRVEPMAFFEHMYAKMPPDLIAQRRELEAYRRGSDDASLTGDEGELPEQYSRMM